ncbi:unnamed protein product [Heligmosomoides polygyrus]|uniref:Reverse transcriptase domain-containing protein n=1 Tax=Heligmosomoides polygyrus TaxID=6339 RepID=A0A183GBS8_HELPZ|nr:unnamed protein product [Heligmosomoides polygyrus]
MACRNRVASPQAGRATQLAPERTIDHIHTITKLIEVSREYKLPVRLTFIDSKKAFESVETEAVLEALLTQGVPTQMNSAKIYLALALIVILITTVSAAFAPDTLPYDGPEDYNNRGQFMRAKRQFGYGGWGFGRPWGYPGWGWGRPGWGMGGLGGWGMPWGMPWGMWG